jgi:hypothetical protein
MKSFGDGTTAAVVRALRSAMSRMLSLPMAGRSRSYGRSSLRWLAVDVSDAVEWQFVGYFSKLGYLVQEYTRTSADLPKMVYTFAPIDRALRNACFVIVSGSKPSLDLLCTPEIAVLSTMVSRNFRCFLSPRQA